MRCWVFTYLLLASLQALPTGMELVHGEASASPARIETEGKTVLSWENFSLAEGESLHFAQRGENPAVLNRVRGSETSRLFGTLTSNGEVFLVNPHGILVGKQGRIETAGFIASTLDLENSLFLSGGALPLQGTSSASIVHEGEIVCKGGRVLLSAHGIESRGRIEAGSIALIASETVWLQPEGAERQFFQESLEKKENPAWIQLSGTLQASRMEEGAKGEIHLFGDTVLVEKEAYLSLDGEKNGDGGSVWILGNERADFFGKISAKGGEEAGDGGFAEVSAPLLEYRGIADLRAPNGKFGTLLLDPSDVVISGSSTTLGVDLLTNPATLPSDNTVTINTTDLVNQLALSNVTIDTAQGGGTGPNSGSITVSNPVSWSANTTLSLIADSFISIGAAISNSYNEPSEIPAMAFTAKGVGAAANNGISLTATLTSATKSVHLMGNASNAASAGHGVSIMSSGGVVTTSGTINIAGVVPSGPASTSDGVRLGKINPLISTSGAINVSGTSLSSGMRSNGVYLLSAWTPGTSGTVTFGDPITDPNTSQIVAGCQGGSGTSSCAIRLEAAFSLSGDLIATNSILGGSGSEGFGCIIFSSISTSTGNIAIKASSRGTSSGCHGIVLSTFGQISTSSGSIILEGTGGPGNGISNGISIPIRLVTPALSTESGDITLIGAAQGTAASNGVFYGSNDGIHSTSGNITIKGTTTASGADAAGVRIDLILNTQSSGSLTFSECAGSANAAGSHGVLITGSLTHAGDLVFTDCVGGNNETIGGNGVSLEPSGVITVNGNVTATGLVGRGNGGLGFKMSGTKILSVTGEGSAIAITAISEGTIGACHGISLFGRTMSTSGGGSITLNGTGGPSSTASHGINITSGTPPLISTETGSGNIFLTGNARGSATSNGIYITSVNTITSTSGNVTLTGTTTSSGDSSRGISIFSAQNTLTSGSLTFLNCMGSDNAPGSDAVYIGSSLTHGGDLFFTNCIGGGSASGGGDGVNISAAPVLGGNVIATGLEGKGNGGMGFFSNASFPVSGAGKSISITAISSGTTGSCHGISLIAGTMRTSGGGSITLNGIGGASSTTSHGINISSATAPRISTETGSGNISLTGIAQGSASSAGIRISLANAITSTSGDIALTGTTTSSGTDSTGVEISAAQNTLTSGSFSFLNCVGSNNGSNSDAVRISFPLTHAGDLLFINCIGGENETEGGNGVSVGGADSSIGGNVIATGIQGQGHNGAGFFATGGFSVSGTDKSISITALSTGTTGNCHGILLSGASMITTGGGAITLNGTGGASSDTSNGIFLISSTGPSISTEAGSGNISLTGSAQGSAPSHGISIISTNQITSASGNITLTGTTTSSGTFSRGVNMPVAQNTLTSGSLTFLNCMGSDNASLSHAVLVDALTHPGDLFFTDCVGGNNGIAGGNGVSFAPEQSTNIGGNLTATGLVGQGNGGIGFSMSSLPGVTISITGEESAIAISASSTGTSGACHGISLTANLMQTTGGGSITLHGTGGASSTASHGIQIAGGSATRISTATGDGNISLTGSAQGSGTSNGINIAFANAITSTSGNITLTGTTTATGSGALGVNIAASSWNMETAGITTINSPGGPIVLGEALTLTGDVDFNTGAGTGSFSAQAITGAYAMTVTTGTATFNGAVGSPTPLVSIAVNANSINVNGAHTVSTGPMQYNGPVTLLGTQAFTNQGALPIAFSSSITGNFPLTIVSDNGAVSVGGAVNTSGAQGGSITVDAAGNILFSSPIEAVSSDGSAGGEIRLTSSGGTVTVDAITN